MHISCPYLFWSSHPDRYKSSTITSSCISKQLYSETRRFVLRRADSVKQLGTAVLDSRVTAVTAKALDRALTRADMYVDKYLPPDNQDATDGKIFYSTFLSQLSQGYFPAQWNLWQGQKSWMSVYASSVVSLLYKASNTVPLCHM